MATPLNPSQQESTDPITRQSALTLMAQHGTRVTAKRNYASRLFGYDIFISFALAAPPRGTHSYASDLARRLRERDFTVYFSEDEASPGEQLDGTLRAALFRSKALVVIANRATLQEPRWVRTEVEEFRKRNPSRPVIPVNVGGALQDPSITDRAQEWLNFRDKIWLDESEEAVETGIASEALLNRLALALNQGKSNVKWRWIVRGIGVILVALTMTAGVAAWIANENANEANRQRTIAQQKQTEAENSAMAEKIARKEAESAASSEKAAREQETQQRQLAEERRAEAETQRTLADKRRQEADEQRRLAEERALIANSQRLAADARSQLEVQLDLAMLLSIEGYRVNPTAQANNALLFSLQQSPYLKRYCHGHTGAALSAAFHPNGKMLATGGANEVVVWEPPSCRPTKILKGTFHLKRLEFSPDGTTLGGHNWLVDSYFWDTRTWEQRGEKVKGLFQGFAPHGQALMVLGQSGEFRRWAEGQVLQSNIPFI